MHLFDEPFDLILKDKKKVEIRLNDEKRRRIRVGDTITFRRMIKPNENLMCQVVKLTVYNSFRDLLESLDPANLDEDIRSLHQIYDETDEKKYGVLAIQFAML